MGQFVNNYFAENGCRNPIIGQVYINGSVQFLGIPNFVRNSGLWCIENLQAPTVPTGWGNAKTPNRTWRVIPGGPYSMWSVPWVSIGTASPAYMPRSLENLHAVSVTTSFVKGIAIV